MTFIKFSGLKRILFLGQSEGKVLTAQANYDKLTVKDGWLQCPVCRRNRRLMRVLPETEGQNVPVYCRDCKTELKIDIHQGQCFESRSR